MVDAPGPRDGNEPPVGAGGRAAIPYTQQIHLHGITFDYWVADRMSRSWYDPALHVSLPENGELARLLAPGDRVLEIGGHHGFYAAWMARRVGTEGVVVSVEPIAFNAMVTGAQFSLNHLTNAWVVAAAASDRPGEVQVSSESNSRVVPTGMPVRAVTGDELDEDFGPFTILKIDVEGYERQVLEGCRRILARRPKIALEVHADDLASYGADIPQLMTIIDAESCVGTAVARSDRYRVMPFTPATVPRAGVSNLFLSLTAR